MSILLTTVFPLALSGAGLSAIAAPFAPAAKPTPVVLPARAVPKIAPVIAPAVVVSTPVVTPAADPVVQPTAGAELVRIQAPSPAPAMTNAAVIDRVGKAFTEVKTAQGNFTQVDAAGNTRTGEFFISRPGKVRFDYKTPEPMFIVSDGVTVSIEEPKRKSYDSMALASTPLHLFLRSNVDLNRDGSVTNVRTSNGSYFVTMVDKTGEAEGRMILEFRASDFELLGWRAIGGDDNETRVSLSGTKRNVSLKPSLFVVKPPEDDRR